MLEAQLTEQEVASRGNRSPQLTPGSDMFSSMVFITGSVVLATTIFHTATGVAMSVLFITILSKMRKRSP